MKATEVELEIKVDSLTNPITLRETKEEKIYEITTDPLGIIFFEETNLGVLLGGNIKTFFPQSSELIDQIEEGDLLQFLLDRKSPVYTNLLEQDRRVYELFDGSLLQAIQKVVTVQASPVLTFRLFV